MVSTNSWALRHTSRSRNVRAAGLDGGIHREASTGVSSKSLTTLEVPVNAFVEHHKDSIQFGYRCFDRILLNGLIQPFQQPERVLGFFNTYRGGQRVTKRTLTGIADHFHAWVKNRADHWGAPILEPPQHCDDQTRRDTFVQQYFQDAQPDQVVVILKAREPARILLAIGGKDNDSPHLEYKQRWVKQYNFYVNDQHWGRIFVRLCPYFPFSARVCLNQHYWLAIRMKAEGIDFQQCTNAFLHCAKPARLQALADSLTARDLRRCGEKWLAAFTPFLTATDRRQTGCQHRLFFSQVEFARSVPRNRSRVMCPPRICGARVGTRGWRGGARSAGHISRSLLTATPTMPGEPDRLARLVWDRARPLRWLAAHRVEVPPLLRAR